ncbi:hypothetical protein M8U16_18355 [Enterobacter hormaechei]|nr:hypothetical protein [Enterobacter hormaechei]
MPIAANYTMHLYCDCKTCTEELWHGPEFGEYVGNTWSECAKEARSHGWRISKDRTRAFAPRHYISRAKP